MTIEMSDRVKETKNFNTPIVHMAIYEKSPQGNILSTHHNNESSW